MGGRDHTDVNKGHGSPRRLQEGHREPPRMSKLPPPPPKTPGIGNVARPPAPPKNG